MKKTVMTIILLVIVGVGGWYLFFDNKTDEELIADQLEKMAEICSKTANESSFSMAAANSGISNLIASRCLVSIKETMMNGSYTPMEFAGSISRARSLFNTLHGTISDVEVTLDQNDNTKASVDYSVRVVGQMKKGRQFDDVRELHSEMKKEDDEWKFASFEIREVLEK